MHESLFGVAEDGVQRGGQVGVVGLDSLGELVAAGGGEGDPAGAPIGGVGLATDQSGGLDAVGELAGAADCDAQPLGQVADAQTRSG